MFRLCVLFIFLFIAPRLITSRVSGDGTDLDDYGSPPRLNLYYPNFFRMGGHEFNYEKMKLCAGETTFSGGAFEGCMIGLSVGLVMGTLRAISLDGVPHAADETPCKVLIGHVFGGLLSGALIGIVHVFLTQCVFRVGSN